MSVSSNEMAIYRQMAISADLSLQKEFLQESRLMKCVLKSRKNIGSLSPKNTTKARDSSDQKVNQRLVNSLTPVPHGEDDLAVEIEAAP